MGVKCEIFAGMCAIFAQYDMLLSNKH